MISSSPGKARSSSRASRRRFLPPLLAALFALTLSAAPASASEPGGWRGWWLPPNYAPHGHDMDMLFYWIFWITMVTFVAVWAVMIVFLVKYRYKPQKRKAVFTHGNTKLEMIWTLVPAVILIILAVLTKRVWDNYRDAPAAAAGQTPPARILVVGEQFKWNTVYPGPDGKLGRYLIFPKPTDLEWPKPDPTDTDPYPFPTEYKGRPTPGPAFMPQAEARKVIDGYLERNRLGKDFTDPAGLDDDWKSSLDRPVFLPKDRPVEIHLASKDVLHDFFLPNYRVKLDAVPGMRGLIYFTASPPKSADVYERETTGVYPLDDLLKKVSKPLSEEWVLLVPEDQTDLPEGVKIDNSGGSRRYFKEVRDTRRRRTVKETIAREGFPIGDRMIADLKAAGLTQVKAYKPKFYDLVCEELCGAGHTEMRGRVIVLDPAEYKRRFETPPETPAPEAPAAVAPAEGPAGAGPQADARP